MLVGPGPSRKLIGRAASRASRLCGGSASWLEDEQSELRGRARGIAVRVRLGCFEPGAVAGAQREAFRTDVELEAAGGDGEELDAPRAVRLAFVKLARLERPRPQFERPAADKQSGGPAPRPAPELKLFTGGTDAGRSSRLLRKELAQAHLECVCDPEQGADARVCLRLLDLHDQPTADAATGGELVERPRSLRPETLNCLRYRRGDALVRRRNRVHYSALYGAESAISPATPAVIGRQTSLVRRLVAGRRPQSSSAGHERRKANRLAKVYEPSLVGGAFVSSAVAVWIVGNFAASPSTFTFLFFVGVTNGAIYALVALGFTLSYNLIGLINLPHGYVFISGAVLSASLLATAGVDESRSFAANAPAIVLVLLIVMGLCGCLSAVIELIAYRPLRNAPRLSRLVTSIGVLFILNNVIIVWTGAEPVARPNVLPGGALFSVMGVPYTWDKFIVLLCMALVLASLYFALQRTRFGRGIRGVVQDAVGAQLVGINVARTATLGFFVAGALAGAGGQLYALYYTNVSWDHALRLTLIAFTAVVLGGIESSVGAVLGALIIGITESFVNGFTWHSPGSEWTESVVLSVLIILLVLRPQGLLGEEPRLG
jgi:branched-chain amino acid transport system permease protein